MFWKLQMLLFNVLTLTIALNKFSNLIQELYSLLSCRISSSLCCSVCAKFLHKITFLERVIVVLQTETSLMKQSSKCFLTTIIVVAQAMRHKIYAASIKKKFFLFWQWVNRANWSKAIAWQTSIFLCWLKFKNLHTVAHDQRFKTYLICKVASC